MCFLHVELSDGDFDDLVPSCNEGVKQALNVVLIGVWEVWAGENTGWLAKRARELHALARYNTTGKT